jgi:hypothetical protein
LSKIIRFSLKALLWEETESLNEARFNSGACKCGSNFVYVFGGRDQFGFLNSIERFNIELKVWSTLKFKLPEGISNLHCFDLLMSGSSDAESIVVMGGMGLSKSSKINNIENSQTAISSSIIDQRSQKKFEVKTSAYLFNPLKGKWLKLKPLPVKKKLIDVNHNGNGKFFLFLSDSSQ